jgi:hypothetical protein
MNTETNELHWALAQMQVLMTQAADVIEHNTKSLAESHSLNGVITDTSVQASLESDTDLVAHLRTAALPWDQRQKQPVTDTSMEKFTGLPKRRLGELLSGSWLKPTLTARQSSQREATQEGRPCQNEGFGWLSPKARTIHIDSGVHVKATWDAEQANCDVVVSLAEQPAPVQQGWRLVPVEPTKEMLDAVGSSMDEFLLGKDAEQQYRDDWEAMLAAAPQPAQQEPVAKFKSPGQRWEDGDDHDSRSEALYKFIADTDFKHCGDSFCFKSGGDGDNGETLMFILDCWFAQQHTSPPAQRKPLTDEWIRSRCGQTWVFETAKQWIRLAEAAHNIKEQP